MFLTRPQFGPSGVSLGHILPQWVGWRSLASKWGCVLESGERTLLKWENLDIKFVSSISWLIPILPPGQVPVAIAYLTLSVKTSALTDFFTKSPSFPSSNLPLAYVLSSWYLISLVSCTNDNLNKFSKRSPANFNLLFA